MGMISDLIITSAIIGKKGKYDFIRGVLRH